MSSTSLRPMNIGDLLDGAFTLYRKNFLTLVGIVGIATAPVVVLELIAGLLLLPVDPFFRGNAGGLSRLPADQLPLVVIGGGLFLVGALFGIVAAIFETGALAIFVSENYLGRRLTIQQAYAHALRRWTGLLGMSLFLMVVYGTLFAVLFFPLLATLVLVGNGANGNPLAVVPLCLLCVLFPLAIIAFYVLSVRWEFAPQAIVIEQYSPLAGLRRSWNLISGSFWRVAGINFVLTILVSIISSVASFSLQFAAVLLPSFVLVNVLSAVLTNMLQMIVLPIQFATLTLLYYDLRVRKEGFDLQLMAEQLAPTTPGQPT